MLSLWCLRICRHRKSDGKLPPPPCRRADLPFRGRDALPAISSSSTRGGHFLECGSLLPLLRCKFAGTVKAVAGLPRSTNYEIPHKSALLTVARLCKLRQPSCINYRTHKDRFPAYLRKMGPWAFHSAMFPLRCRIVRFLTKRGAVIGTESKTLTRS